jgi:hypothetical protein
MRFVLKRVSTALVDGNTDTHVCELLNATRGPRDPFYLALSIHTTTDVLPTASALPAEHLRRACIRRADFAGALAELPAGRRLPIVFVGMQNAREGLYYEIHAGSVPGGCKLANIQVRELMPDSEGKPERALPPHVMHRTTTFTFGSEVGAHLHVQMGRLFEVVTAYLLRFVEADTEPTAGECESWWAAYADNLGEVHPEEDHLAQAVMIAMGARNPHWREKVTAGFCLMYDRYMLRDATFLARLREAHPAYGAFLTVADFTLALEAEMEALMDSMIEPPSMVQTGTVNTHSKLHVLLREAYPYLMDLLNTHQPELLARIAQLKYTHDPPAGG